MSGARFTSDEFAAPGLSMEQMAAYEAHRPAFRGPLHLPGEAAYDAHRATWSGSIDPRPAVVAEASTPSDVRAAVLIAREHGLPFAVQATGHGTHVPADGGLLLKTSAMAEVLVDPDRRIARVGPGALWGDVIAAAAPCGLAPVTGSSPSVGVAGFTLGGGVGWLSRKLGFAADNLLRADVVTADGRLLRASAHEHPDLFWALRGGGGNFGVVTALELRLHPVSRVYAGTATFPIARAAEILARYRAWAPRMPEELTTTLVLTRDAVSVRAAYLGDARAAERALRPLFEVAGPPATSDLRAMGYPETALLGGTPPRQFELFADLPDAVIAAAVDATARANAVELRHWGGAMRRGAGPVGHRDVPFSITVDGDPDEPLARHATGGSFLNFLKDPARTHTAYTASDHRLLRAVKRAYDPDNLFATCLNIPPATGERLPLGPGDLDGVLGRRVARDDVLGAV
jgi:FAD/FMN-containing dehydrogenase